MQINSPYLEKSVRELELAAQINLGLIGFLWNLQTAQRNGRQFSLKELVKNHQVCPVQYTFTTLVEIKSCAIFSTVKFKGHLQWTYKGSPLFTKDL